MKKKLEPGPAGSLICPPNYVPRGRPKGVKGKKREKLSPKQLENLRTAGYRKNVGGLMRKHAVVAGKRAEENLSAILDAVEGKYDPLARVNAGKLARLSTIQDAALDEVEERGVLIVEEVSGSDGAVLSTRQRENPALGAALRLGEVLGVSAKENLLTPASRSSSNRDESVGRYFEQQARVSAWRDGRAHAIPTTVVEDPEVAE